MKAIVALVFSFVLIATSIAETPPKEAEALWKYGGRRESTLDGSPKAIGSVPGEWIVGHRFLQRTWVLDEIPGVSPKQSGTSIMSYDATKRVYRISQFFSNGSSASGEGVWDEAAQAFTWTVKDPVSGNTTVTKSSFGKDVAETWTKTTTSNDGKAVSTASGKNMFRTGLSDLPAAVLEKFGGFTVTDGASWYNFAKDGKFRSGPMGMSGRRLDGKWTLTDNYKFTVIAMYGWMNGFSALDDYRRIVFSVLHLEKRTVQPEYSFGAPPELFDGYWYIDEFVKIPKPE